MGTSTTHIQPAILPWADASFPLTIFHLTLSCVAPCWLLVPGAGQDAKPLLHPPVPPRARILPSPVVLVHLLVRAMEQAEDQRRREAELDALLQVKQLFSLRGCELHTYVVGGRKWSKLEGFMGLKEASGGAWLKVEGSKFVAWRSENLGRVAIIDASNCDTRWC